LWLEGERSKNGPSEIPLPFIRQLHQEIGIAVLAKWEVAPEVLFVAGAHHDDVPSEPSPYWSLAVVASALADGLGTQTDITRHAPPPELLIDRCAAELQVGPAVLDKLRTQLRPEVASLLGAFA
jgi:hypothetical protein